MKDLTMGPAITSAIIPAVVPRPEYDFAQRISGTFANTETKSRYSGCGSTTIDFVPLGGVVENGEILYSRHNLEVTGIHLSIGTGASAGMFMVIHLPQIGGMIIGDIDIKIMAAQLITGNSSSDILWLQSGGTGGGEYKVEFFSATVPYLVSAAGSPVQDSDFYLPQGKHAEIILYMKGNKP